MILIDNDQHNCENKNELNISSFGSPNNMIIHTTTSGTFTWSDFPLLMQDTTKSNRNQSTLTKEIIMLPPKSMTSNSINNGSNIRIRKKTKRKHTSEKRVSFCPMITIHYYAIALGEHPFCSGNLPLTLGRHKYSEVVNFDYYCYENERYCYNHNYRPLSYMDRAQLLQSTTGLSEQELLEQELQNHFRTQREEEIQEHIRREEKQQEQQYNTVMSQSLSSSKNFESTLDLSLTKMNTNEQNETAVLLLKQQQQNGYYHHYCLDEKKDIEDEDTTEKSISYYYNFNYQICA